MEIVDEQDANRALEPGKVVTAVGTGDLSRFVDSANGEVQTRVRYRADNPQEQFTSNTDQLYGRLNSRIDLIRPLYFLVVQFGR